MRKYDKNETQIFYEYLQGTICTATMATAATGITQKNVTRYKRDLEKQNLLFVVAHKPCPLTGFVVQWITCDKMFRPKASTQLSLFDQEVGKDD